MLGLSTDHYQAQAKINFFFNILLTMYHDDLCNDNQLDALFILNLFRQSTSMCFGHVYCPSSGGIHCICAAFGVCYMFRLTSSWSC
jgi:hypothetical protein